MEINLSNLTKKEAFVQTLKHMPRTFSSYQFGIFVRQNGFDLPKNGGTDIGDFLKARKELKRISNRMYVKKHEDHIADITLKINPLKESTREEINKIYASDSMPVETVSLFLEKLPIDSIINHVKSKGYLVLKP